MLQKPAPEIGIVRLTPDSGASFIAVCLEINMAAAGFLLCTDNQHSIIFNVCKMLQPDFFVMHLLVLMHQLFEIGSAGCRC